MAKKLKALIIIFLFILSIIIPVFIIFLLPVNVATLDFDYDDDCIFGTDSPVSNFDVMIYLDTIYLETMTTDDLGIIDIYMTEVGEYTYRVEWQGGDTGQLDIDESISSTIEIELATFTLQSSAMFYWSHDMSPVVSQSIGLVYDGMYVTSILTNAIGRLDSDLLGLTIGSEWQFMGATANLTIMYYDLAVIPDEVFYITPKGIIISIILSIIILLGIIFYYKKLKNKTTHKYGIANDIFNNLVLNLSFFFRLQF